MRREGKGRGVRVRVAGAGGGRWVEGGGDHVALEVGQGARRHHEPPTGRERERLHLGWVKARMRVGATVRARVSVRARVRARASVRARVRARVVRVGTAPR